MVPPTRRPDSADEKTLFRRCSSSAVVYDKVDKDVDNEVAIVEEVNVKTFYQCCP